MGRAVGVMALGLATCGCLSKARTPYNEVGLFGGEATPSATATMETSVTLPELKTPPRKTLNLWPLYIGDGRAHYVAWPFVK